MRCCKSQLKQDIGIVRASHACPSHGAATCNSWHFPCTSLPEVPAIYSQFLQQDTSVKALLESLSDLDGLNQHYRGLGLEPAHFPLRNVLLFPTLSSTQPSSFELLHTELMHQVN